MNLKYLYMAFALQFGASDLILLAFQQIVTFMEVPVDPQSTVFYAFIGLALLLKLLAVIFAILSRDNLETRALSVVAVIITSLSLVTNLIQIALSAVSGQLM